MPSAIADGWLLGVLAIFISVLLPLLRWVANRWSEAREEAVDRAEQAERKIEALKDEAVKRTEALYEARIQHMILESRLERCESERERERDDWKSGGWHTE